MRLWIFCSCRSSVYQASALLLFCSQSHSWMSYHIQFCRPTGLLHRLWQTPETKLQRVGVKCGRRIDGWIHHGYKSASQKNGVKHIILIIAVGSLFYTRLAAAGGCIMWCQVAWSGVTCCGMVVLSPNMRWSGMKNDKRTDKCKAIVCWPSPQTKGHNLEHPYRFLLTASSPFHLDALILKQQKTTLF